jgi:hypothetical protein
MVVVVFEGRASEGAAQETVKTQFHHPSAAHQIPAAHPRPAMMVTLPDLRALVLRTALMVMRMPIVLGRPANADAVDLFPGHVGHVRVKLDLVVRPVSRVAAAGDLFDRAPVRYVQNQYLFGTNKCEDGFFNRTTCLLISDFLEPFFFDLEHTWS